MRRRPLGGAAQQKRLRLVGLACFVALTSCSGADLPPLATRAPAGSDGTRVTVSTTPSATDAGADAEPVIVVGPSEPTDAGAEPGQILVTVGLPVDTATGQVAPIGSVTLKLTASDQSTTRLLTLEFGQPRLPVAVNLTDVPAGGPYRLEISGAQETGSCEAPDVSFSVPSGATVGVAVALLCPGDAGWTATI
jgi:hypothetical protein